MNNISTILVLLFVYVLMLVLITTVSKRRNAIFLYSRLSLGNLKLLNYVHGTSILIMLIPMLFINQPPLFLLTFPDEVNFDQAIAFLGSFGVIGFFPWRKFNNRIAESGEVSIAGSVLYASLRIIFLIIYEWFLRGLLLISFMQVGFGWAILINTLLYVLLHAHKSKKETIGCLPLGLFLCSFTIWLQSIWPAIIFHVQIAIINEWPSLKQFIPRQKQATI